MWEMGSTRRFRSSRDPASGSFSAPRSLRDGAHALARGAGGDESRRGGPVEHSPSLHDLPPRLVRSPGTPLHPNGCAARHRAVPPRAGHDAKAEPRRPEANVARTAVGEQADGGGSGGDGGGLGACGECSASSYGMPKRTPTRSGRTISGSALTGVATTVAGAARRQKSSRPTGNTGAATSARRTTTRPFIQIVEAQPPSPARRPVVVIGCTVIHSKSGKYPAGRRNASRASGHLPLMRHRHGLPPRRVRRCGRGGGRAPRLERRPASGSSTASSSGPRWLRRSRSRGGHARRVTYGARHRVRSARSRRCVFVTLSSLTVV